MTEYEILCKLVKLAREHDDLIFEIDEMGLKLRWYGYIDGKPYNFNQLYDLRMIEFYGLDKCIEVFETMLEEEKNKVFRGEVNENSN